ncbi:MAG TPA: response regulator transcription factor [Pirellulales bacterium]|nr:response regulator transcription factor [Pirellulales bacterium]
MESQTIQRPIRVALVENDEDTRARLSATLRQSKNIALLDAYPSAQRALRGMKCEPPQVALIGLDLSGKAAIEGVARLKTALPMIEYLILTASEDHELAFESLLAGASGCVSATAPPYELFEAIRQVSGGESPVSFSVARKLVRHLQTLHQARDAIDELTSREREVLSLLAKGYYYKEIAERLAVSVSTVRAHLHAVYRKLHVQSRTEAVLKFLGT